MRSRQLAFVVTLAACASVAGIPSRALAQRTWPEPGPPPFIGIEVGKGVYTPIATAGGMLQFGMPTSTVTASVWVPFGRRFTLTGELPVSHTSYQVGAAKSGSTIVGDPWIGLEMIVGRDWTWELGVRPGIGSASRRGADTLALTNGIAADYDHYEAWRQEKRALRSSMHYDHEFAGGFFIGGLAGASFAWSTGPAAPPEYNPNEQFSWFEKQEVEHQAFDAYVLYGLRAGYRDAGVTASLAFIGRGYPTAHGPLTEPMVNQIALDVGKTSGRVRPITSLRIYRDRFLQPRTRAVVSFGVKVWR